MRKWFAWKNLREILLWLVGTAVIMTGLILCSPRQVFFGSGSELLLGRPVHLLHSEDEIAQICIVELEYPLNGELMQTVLTEVADVKGFMEELNRVEGLSLAGCNPSHIIFPGEGSKTVLKILYNNGDYDLIDWNGQGYYEVQTDTLVLYSYSSYDKAQFEALIEKYLGGG